MSIVGVDEAGRGALIGNVVAAAVILPKDFDQKEITDSKKLTEKKRFQLEDYIKENAISYAIAKASPKEIDQLNIHHATLLAMKRAILGLEHPITKILIDGKFCPDAHFPCKAIVGGDNLYPVISTASILAKTYRDRELIELDQIYPNYGFKQHKGYPTKAHIQAIREFGILEEHRKSYKTIKAFC